MNQLSLDGFDAAPQVHSLFFALRPDAAAAARIRNLARCIDIEQSLNGKLLAADRLHVTLHASGKFPAEMPHRLLQAVSEKVSSVRFAPIHVTFDHVMSFSGSRAVVLCGSEAQCEPIVALRDALKRALGFPDHWSKPGRLHMTLLYAPRMLDERRVEPVTWTASELVLIDSLEKKTQHVTLARWPLEHGTSAQWGSAASAAAAR